jgi:hypothetical protein
MVILALAVSPLAVPLLGGSSPGDVTAYASLLSGGRADLSQQISNPGGDDDGNGINDDGTANNRDDDDGDDDNGNDNNDDDGNDGNDDDDDGGNNDDDGDGDDNDNGGNDDDNGDDNDNGDGNDSDDGDDDGGDDNDNNDGDDNDNNDGDDGDDNDNVRVIVRHPNESVNRPTKCFDTREVGVVQLGTGSYDVTVTVMPHSSFNQTTRLTLKSIDPASAPAVSGGTLVDSVVFELKAQSSCDGADINPLPNLVNLGIVYNVPVAVDKAKLQIVRWTGSAWTNVDTVPDPVAGNPYVSATINMAGTYALIQKP